MADVIVTCDTCGTQFSISKERAERQTVYVCGDCAQ